LGSNNPLASSELAPLLTLFDWEAALPTFPELTDKVIHFHLPPPPPPIPLIKLLLLELFQEVMKILIIDKIAIKIKRFKKLINFFILSPPFI
jgi:hypothetical protein